MESDELKNQIDSDAIKVYHPESGKIKHDNTVNSTAIVKFESVEVPASFSRLKCNTNLNMPPSNWLSNSAYSYGFSKLQSASGFSSFQLANQFPDLCGRVDVISDSENIKNLLKTPYLSQKGILSYFVHRVGNTLLIDEFDLHKYLLRKSDEDWEWLRSFIYENILNSLNENERKVFIKLKTREAIQQKTLMSKFLYYSIESNTVTKVPKNFLEHPSESEDNLEKHLQLSIPKQCDKFPLLPEPKKEENLPDPLNEHVFSRNVLWTFEDISMLVGSDMQIFGNFKRPCVSLRLRDMKKPINILTGIDYWLDNLMCNVPEVVMCYHLDGIVQKYELIKTEDLPHLENSEFSPKIIRNVAQNILSFLKSNATKAGRTYWLFKGKNDDVVKLYDLTTLCEDKERAEAEAKRESEGEKNEKTQNPFTVPVAMLLYNVARNMRYEKYENVSAKRAGSIKMLLDNCVKLLAKEKHWQILTSSHYMLSDLHVPTNTNPATGIPTNSDSDDSDDMFDESLDHSPVDSDCEDGELVKKNEYSPAIQNIRETLKEYNVNEKLKYSKSAPPLSGTIEERCEIALKHIIEGLSCLQFFEDEPKEEKTESEKEQILREEQNPNMAKPFNPIPLPYESLKKEAKTANPKEVIPMPWNSKESEGKTGKKSKKKQKKINEDSNKTNETAMDQYNLDSKSLLLKKTTGVIKNWHVHLKILLFEKACLVYATIAESQYSKENYGEALKSISIAIKCQELVTKYITLVTSQNSCLLGRAGDCYFNMCKNIGNISSHQKDFEDENEMDKLILEELSKDMSEEEFIVRQIVKPEGSIEELFDRSCQCYEVALKSCTKDSQTELKRRLGNVYNELGVYLIHVAQKKYNSFVESSTTEDSNSEPKSTQEGPSYQQMAKRSYDCIMKSIQLFNEVEDFTNLVICQLNLGRFYRFAAHANIYGNDVVSFQSQRKFYNESFASYQRALGILESRKNNTELWDLVSWELSSSCFTFAKQLQDNNDGEFVDALEQEVVDMLKKSLKFCDNDSAKFSSHYSVLYSFRSALIHHRLASFYHNSLRSSSVDESKKRTTLQLCRLNYEKAAKLLENLKECKDFLQVQIERIALQEYQAESAQTSQQKIQNYKLALPLFYQSDTILKHIAQLDSYEQFDVTEFEKLLDLFEKRLQEVLKNLAKLLHAKNQNPSTKKDKQSEKQMEIYKKMFGLTLRSSMKLQIKEFSEHLVNVLKKISNCENDKI